MANYHSDEWIMEKVREHYEEALTLFPEDRIIGIFYQGSGNYGLDTPESDVDTKLIVAPTWDDVCFNRKPVSTTHIRENNEHIDLKDIRLMFQTFRKQNLNFIEILFTKYKIINPLYESLWNELVAENEMIARYNPLVALKTMKGIAKEKYHAMEHRYPAKIEIIDKYGYDCKQLHHLERVEEYIERYIAGISYADCLISEKPEYLKEVKSHTKYTLEEARKRADISLARVEKMVKEYEDWAADRGFKLEDLYNPAVDRLLDKVQDGIMRIAIRRELIAVCPECGEPLVWRAHWDLPMYECPNCSTAWAQNKNGKLLRYYFG